MAADYEVIHFTDDYGNDRWRAVHRSGTSTDYSIVQFLSAKDAEDFIARWRRSLALDPKRDWEDCWRPDYLTESCYDDFSGYVCTLCEIMHPLRFKQRVNPWGGKFQ